MSKIIEKNAQNVSNNLSVIGVYSIYDCVLKQFQAPICVPKSKVKDYFTLLVNEVQSPYYNHESDYILNEIGIFNQDTGEIEMHFVERISLLDSFIDEKKRNLQTILQTLNYLPTGYFKMPTEQKELIQQNIDEMTKKYVENYVVPDLDISSERIKLLEEKINDYEQRLNIVS